MEKSTIEKLREYKEDAELNFGDKCSSYNGYYGVEQSYIRESLTNGAKERINNINNILKDLIEGFNCFYNFTDTKIRYSYDYGNGFIGVGYMSIEELEEEGKNNIS